LGLTPDKPEALQQLFATASEAKLKANVALVLGSLRPDPRQTGERLKSFTPTFTPAAPPAAKGNKEEGPPKDR
jgi:hypothetical protein